MNDVQDRRTACYSLVTHEALAVLSFHGDIYELGTNLSMKEELLCLIRAIDESPGVHALLLLNDPGILGEDQYNRFISEAMGAGIVRRQRVMERLNYTLTHFLMEILEFSKLVLVGYEGEVAATLFGAGLAADYRFASEDMTLHNSHLQLGNAPGGGLGFFLPRMVGPVSARDLLMAPGPIPARELHELGLLDACLPRNGFREECLRRAGDLARVPLPAILGVKAILHSYGKDLLEFLERENEAVEAAMIRMTTLRK